MVGLPDGAPQTRILSASATVPDPSASSNTIQPLAQSLDALSQSSPTARQIVTGDPRLTASPLAKVNAVTSELDWATALLFAVI